METATPKAENAPTPSQVFAALARIQQLVDAACGDGNYRITAEFDAHQKWLGFHTTANAVRKGHHISTHLPGNSTVASFMAYAESAELARDLGTISGIMVQESPTNPSNHFPRPIEEYTEIYGSCWVGGSDCGGVRILAKTRAFNRTNIHASPNDTTPEVDEFNSRIYKAASLVTAALSRLNCSTDPEILQRIKDQKEQLLSMFGDQKIYVRELPNGYGSKDDPYWGLFPWFEVTTSRGPITIGWRKSDIHIEWSESDVEPGGHELFPDENVTRGDRYIHAWGYQKAMEYLDRILAWQPEEVTE